MRKLVLDLTAEDWARLESLHPTLRQVWSKGLQLQAKSIRFATGLAPVVRVKLLQLPPRLALRAVEPIWIYLQSEWSMGAGGHGDNDLGPRLQAIANLPSELFPDSAAMLATDGPLPEMTDASDQNSMNDNAPMQPEAYSQDGLDGDLPRATKSRASELRMKGAVDDLDEEALRSALNELRTIQPVILQELDHAMQSVSNGEVVPGALLGTVDAWNALFDNLPDSIESPASIASLTRLVEAADAATASARADQALADRVLGMSFVAAPPSALIELEPLRLDAASAQSPLDPSLRDTLAAFVRVTTSDVWDRDFDDLSRLEEAYGPKFSMIAARLVAVSDDIAQTNRGASGQIDEHLPSTAHVDQLPDARDQSATPANYREPTPAVQLPSDEPTDVVTGNDDSGRAAQETEEATIDDVSQGGAHQVVSTEDLLDNVANAAPPAAAEGLERGGDSTDGTAFEPSSDDGLGYSRTSSDKQSPESVRESLAGGEPAPPEGIARDEAESAAEPVQDPWSNGEIASLVSAGQETLAVVVAESLGVSDTQARMLRLFAGAFGSRADTLLAQELELFPDDSADANRSADDNRLLFASYSRLALELGYSPVGSLDRFRQAAAMENHPAAAVAAEIERLVTRGFKRPLGAVQLTALPDDWRSYADAVEARLELLKSTRISYQRASKIIHYLVRANQPIGGVLENCIGLARQCAMGVPSTQEDWGAAASLLVTLRDPRECERLLSDADHALSTSQQLRNEIIASARDRLFSAMDEVAALLEEGLALRARAEGPGAADSSQGMADLVSLAREVKKPGVRSVGDAAMQRLVDWVCADDATVGSSAPLGQLVAEELMPLFEIPRDRSGAPERSLLSPSEVQTLIDGRDPIVVVRGYLGVGNVRMVEQVLRANPQIRSTAVDDEVLQTQQALARRHRELVSEVDRVVDRLRSLNDDDLVRQLSQELEEHREPTQGRFDLHLGPLTEIRDRGEALLDEVRTHLRQRAAALSNMQESQRIVGLLESRDEQLAVDYLTLAEAGEPLPVLSRPAGDDFGVFFPDVVRVAETLRSERSIDNIQAIRKHLGESAGPRNRMLREGLRSWSELVVDRATRPTTELRLANILRLLGLIPADERWLKELTRAKNSGYATYAVKASPIDRSYVPSLGTQAHGSYDVTIVWDEASPQRLLQYVETNRRTQANIILYLRTLAVEQRLELRKLTARTGFDFSPIVVDMPVVAWLSTRGEPGWRLTQRVTLPFTTLNPYTPFAGGEVPDEVFVGRETERREIIEPTGSMFVYGGRQLGKSALLRRVERGIMSHPAGGEVSFEHGHVAVYLDLKSEGIGESAPTSALWGALAPRLTKVGVLAPTASEATADSVAAGIVSWLESDSTRRLLLLLDEADNFLTLDAKGDPKGSGSAQVGGFPVLQRLKGIMETTGRRFKPVFAGLHQVQRFHGLPNTPVVHGGKDILIGPLRPVDARELVRDPLFVLGYEFETQDTMWRLLRLTNYQASLIQIICEALVRHMRTRDLPRAGGRAVIQTRDVDDIYAKREVRDLIAQRFRWTINLDSRYKVIALVTALRSLESKPGERFRASDLHDECAYFWPEGFARNVLSSSEFLRYLSEMQGLGVLHRQGDEFGLRSPSILGLLGSRDTIEAELLEAPDQLDVAYQYNPTMNRRILSQDPAGAETRSPLPDSELAALLSNESGVSRVTIVVGTRALGLDRVATALHRAAGERQIHLVSVDVSTLLDQIEGDGDIHLILDLASADAAARRSALGVLQRFPRARATVVLPAEDANRDLAGFDWPRISLHRWSAEGLKSWHEFPVQRSDLKNVTGGWPELVERAISLVTRGASPETALDTIASELSDPKAAQRFLARAGVAPEISQTWIEWFGKDGTAGSVSILPASIDDLSAAFDSDARPILEHLQLIDVVDETLDGWILDGVIASASRHSQG